MPNRESALESYLDQKVRKIGGLTRKFVCPGNRGVTDRIVIYKGTVWFVELKTVDGVTASHQIREHNKLISVGANVAVLVGHKEVREFVEKIKNA